MQPSSIRAIHSPSKRFIAQCQAKASSPNQPTSKGFRTCNLQASRRFIDKQRIQAPTNQHLKDFPIPTFKHQCIAKQKIQAPTNQHLKGFLLATFKHQGDFLACQANKSSPNQPTSNGLFDSNLQASRQFIPQAKIQSPTNQHLEGVQFQPSSIKVIHSQAKDSSPQPTNI